MKNSHKVMVGAAMTLVVAVGAWMLSDSMWGAGFVVLMIAMFVLGMLFEQEKTAEDGPVKPYKGPVGEHGVVASPRRSVGFPAPLSDKAVADDEWDCVDEPLDDQIRNTGYVPEWKRP